MSSIVSSTGEYTKIPESRAKSPTLATFIGFPCDSCEKLGLLLAFSAYHTEQAKQTRMQFAAHYQEKYQSVEDVLQNSVTIYLDYISKAANTAIDRLIAKGEYDLTVQSFYEEYLLQYTVWYESLQELEEQLREYRDARRAGRGRIVGGGLGLVGAAKGMITAGAANLAIGAVHGAFIFLGNIISNVDKNSKLRAFFSRPTTLDSLANAVYHDVLSIGIALGEAMTEKGYLAADSMVSTVFPGSIGQRAARCTRSSAWLAQFVPRHCFLHPTPRLH